MSIIVRVRIACRVLRIGNATFVERLRVALRAVVLVFDVVLLRPFVSSGMSRAVIGAVKTTVSSALGACEAGESKNRNGCHSGKVDAHGHLSVPSFAGAFAVSRAPTGNVFQQHISLVALLRELFQSVVFIETIVFNVNAAINISTTVEEGQETEGIE